MHDIDIIALLLTIIAIFIAIWFLRKVLILIAILIIVAVIGYLYLQNNQDFTTNSTPSPRHSRNIEMLDKFKDNYCGMLYDRDDSLMCQDIVEPIYDDIVNNYNLDSVRSLSKRQMFHFLVQVASKNKGRIIRSLKRDNALYLWSDFVQDLKHFYSF